MSVCIELSAATPPDLELVAGGGASPIGAFAEGTAADELQDESTSPGGVSSVYEQNAVAALLGLHTACVETSSPDDDSRDDDLAPTGSDGMGAFARWGDHDAKRWPHLTGAHGYSSPIDRSPKTFRSFDYETPGQASPKRQRQPKDGARLPTPPEAIPPLHFGMWAGELAPARALSLSMPRPVLRCATSRD